MAKITVDELERSALEDPLFAQAYHSPLARIRRVMSEALFRLRKERNLTQAALAERAGWQQPYIARIERGEAQMITGLEALENFAQAADATSIVLFVDRQTGQVRAKVPLGDADQLPQHEYATVKKAKLVLPDDLRQLEEQARQVVAEIEKMRAAQKMYPVTDFEITTQRQPVGKT